MALNLWQKAKIFAKAYRAYSSPSYVIFRPETLHRHTIYVMGCIRERNWNLLGDIFDCQSAGSRHCLLEAVAHECKDPQTFDPWIELDPKNPAPHLFKGTQMLHLAWVYRGGGRGTDLDDESVESFWGALSAASEQFETVLSLCPGNAEAAASLIRVSMGQSGHWDDMNICLQYAADAEIPHQGGCLHYLTAASEKWLGSHDDMFDFARAYSLRDGDPGYMASLLAYAHFMMWQWTAMFDGDKEAADAYFRRSEVIEELVAAWDVFADRFDERDIYFNKMAHNHFACVFSLAGRHDLAREEFKQMGTMVTRFPWEFVGFEFAQKSREKCGLERPQNILPV